MTYEVILSQQADNYFARLPRDVARRVVEVLKALESNPKPPGAMPLTGVFRGLYRMRVGGLRIVYNPNPAHGRIRVVSILPRGDAY